MPNAMPDSVRSGTTANQSRDENSRDNSQKKALQRQTLLSAPHQPVRGAGQEGNLALRGDRSGKMATRPISGRTVSCRALLRNTEPAAIYIVQMAALV